MTRRGSPSRPSSSVAAGGAAATRCSTEYAFVLPRGYVDATGVGPPRRRHAPRHGPGRDHPPARPARPRERGVPDGPAAVAGRHPARHAAQVHTGVIEGLFASDLAFLQDLYRRINQEGHTQAAVTCPACNHEFTVDMAGEQRLGES